MGRIAIFIDGGYLDRMLRDEFGKPRLDFAHLAQAMTSSHELLRTYYYHCLPYQSNPPTDSEKKRFSDRQGFYATLDKLPRFEVRLGRLVYRGIDEKSNKPIFEQKRVDLMLGIDLVLLSAKHQITHAAILTGDSDFIPAIEIAKYEGVVVHLFHGTNPHNELWGCVDERTRIDKGFIQPLLRP